MLIIGTRRYKDDVYFTKPMRAVNSVNAFPYYRYPRTKDGPMIPELVEHVLGNIPYIIFVLPYTQEEDAAN